MGQRQRTVNEKAVNKTLDFLNKLYTFSGKDYQTPLSLLYGDFHISKSTGSVCVKLEIIIVKKGIYAWISKEQPSREMALKVLEVLRQRSDKNVTVPLAGFEEMVNTLKEIADSFNRVEINGVSEPVNITIPKETKMLHRALNQATPNNQTLFSETDKKLDDLIKIASAIAGSVWGDVSSELLSLEGVSIVNSNICIVSQDLLNKLYNVK